MPESPKALQHKETTVTVTGRRGLDVLIFVSLLAVMLVSSRRLAVYFDFPSTFKLPSVSDEAPVDPDNSIQN